MLDENGMIFDDGVTVRLADQHYMMTTTTGGAARVLTWLERWLQTEWPDMRRAPRIGDGPLGDVRGGRPEQPQGAAEGVSATSTSRTPRSRS